MGDTALSGLVGVGVWVTLITPKVNTYICVTHSNLVQRCGGDWKSCAMASSLDTRMRAKLNLRSSMSTGTAAASQVGKNDKILD